MAQRINRFSVGQAAKFVGVLQLMFGLLFTPIFLLVAVVAPKEAAGFGVPFALGMPILYGIFGLIGGAIGAALYNLVAGWIGGIEVEIDPA